MPTGYTSMIDDDPTITTKRWIMEGLSRAFGVCVSLRDDPFNLDEQQILARIANSEQQSIEYHQEELINAHNHHAFLQQLSNEDWRVDWKKHLQTVEETNAKSIEQSSRKQQHHEHIRDELLSILASPNIEPTTQNIVEFGVKQLGLVAYECKPFVQELPTFEQFTISSLKSATWKIDYHKKELNKAQIRKEERVNAYVSLRKNLDVILEESSK